jgi:anti-anti-sigma regulatory factor
LKKMKVLRSPHPQSPGQDDGLLTISALAGRVGLRLAGDVDASSHDRLRSALAALPADGITAAHLELAGLDFMDVAGTRELIALMQSHPGLRLILHDPPESLRRILALLWPGTNAELLVDGTPSAAAGSLVTLTSGPGTPPNG